MAKRNTPKSSLKAHVQDAPKDTRVTLIMTAPEEAAFTEAWALASLAGHKVPKTAPPWLCELALSAALTYGTRAEILRKAEAALAEARNIEWAANNLPTDDPARRGELWAQAFSALEQAMVALLVLTRTQRSYEQDARARAQRVEDLLESSRMRSR